MTVSKKALRLPTVSDRVGKPKSSIYYMIKHGQFPRPISLSVRSVGWLEEDIEAWLQSRPQR